MNKIKYIILLFILLLLIIPTIVAVDDSIKADSTIIVNANNITVGDIEKITVHVNEDATGVINITVDGKNYSAPIDKGIATFKIDNLASGSYDVSASYDGDENYLPGTNTSSFNVEKPGASASVPVKANEKTKANSTIIVNANNIAMGDSEKITVRVNEDATGSVTITVDGKTYSAPIDKGLTTFKIDNLASGSYDVLASYDGDENYLPGTNTSSFSVGKHNAPISVSAKDVKEGENAVVHVILPAGATGSVKVTVYDKSYTNQLIDGKTTVTVPVKANEKTKANSTIIVNANNIAMGDSEKITVRVNEDATGSVTITVDGKTYSAPIDKGLTTFKIDNLASGSYDVLASYDGDENYLPGTNTSSFSVGKHNAPISVSAKDVKEGENAVVHVILPAGATGSVKVTVYDKSYTNQLIDGKTTVTVPDLAKGSYIVNVNYSGDDNYLANSTQVPLSVGKKAVEPPAIENNTDENLNDIGLDASTGLPIAILAIALIIIVAVVIVKRK